MNMSIRNIAIIALSFLFSFTAQGQTADKMPDKDQLAVALDYFEAENTGKHWISFQGLTKNTSWTQDSRLISDSVITMNGITERRATISIHAWTTSRYTPHMSGAYIILPMPKAISFSENTTSASHCTKNNLQSATTKKKVTSSSVLAFAIWTKANGRMRSTISIPPYSITSNSAIHRTSRQEWYSFRKWSRAA